MKSFPLVPNLTSKFRVLHLLSLTLGLLFFFHSAAVNLTFCADSSFKTPSNETPNPLKSETKNDFELPAQILRDKLEPQSEFGEALDQMWPITPEELQIAKNRQEALEEAKAPLPAKLNFSIRQIHATPGQVPQIVHLTLGYTSTLVFQDVSGKPWPILAVVLGNPSAYTALQPKIPTSLELKDKLNKNQDLNGSKNNQASHFLNLVPLTPRGSSNVVITLEDCLYPVRITLFYLDLDLYGLASFCLFGHMV